MAIAREGMDTNSLRTHLIETTTVYTHLTPISHVEAIGYINDLVTPILKR